ncbi:MAG: DUF4157 domain-containing protein, partial [Actinobacteria bacterium]|nr:DUF4157 domain-containing protein [Actinomycetota bacterium]
MPDLHRAISALGANLHTNTAAARFAASLGASAVTAGRDVFFAHGSYQPSREAGRRLIAHELAHVAQSETGAPVILRRQPYAADARVPLEPPTNAAPVRVALDPREPWLAEASSDATPDAVALELYGVDIGAAVDTTEVLRFTDGIVPQTVERFVILPDMLRPHYRQRFDVLMGAQLDTDVREVKSILFETRIDADDEDTLIRRVRWWSERRDVTDDSGRSYFDVFLGRLHNARWYTDYGLWESSSRPYLDLLYDEVEERAGELNTLIANNSREFGAYQPLWSSLRDGAVGTAQGGPNEDLVARSVELILERLEGHTSETESGTIADVLIGLPAREKAAVLNSIMQRYDERHWTYVLGRFGEAWEGGMLFWLFEDLEESDLALLAESIKDSGVMAPEAVDSLVAGRGWGGKYLPWSTYHGQQAAQYWADVYTDSEGATAAGALVAGGFASLWTPETAGATTLTLVTAGVAPGIAEASPMLGRGMLVTGTGVTSYQTTLAAGELMSGRDAYSGEPLGDEEKIARVLHVISGLLMLGAGFATARGLGARAAPSLDTMVEVGAAGSGRGDIRWRMLGTDPVTGDVTAIGTATSTGRSAVIRLNPRTGTGSVTDLTTGAVHPVRGFQLDAPARALLPAAGEGPVASQPPPASALPARPVAPELPAPSAPGAGQAAGLTSEVSAAFAEAQAMVPPETLGDLAVAEGLAVQPAPDIFYVDPVSGDFLPWYYNAASGTYSPHWLEPARIGS